MKKILKNDFYNRNTKVVAKELLGKFLVNKKISYMITDVEVYDGFKDLASHASKGKTLRNEIMFQSAGRWYVYFVYGIHYMLNIVTREKGYPAAILIRGVEGIRGPGKVTKAYGIDKSFNGKSASKDGLYIEDRGIVVKKIKKSSRIGVSYAGDIWSKKHLRFYL